MKKTIPLFFLTSILISQANVASATIFQCKQPDGTIEFTNKGCAKSNRLQAKRTFSEGYTKSHIILLGNGNKSNKKKNRTKAPFRQADFIQVQKKMLGAGSREEMEKFALTITNKVKASAQEGRISDAYNLVAATYAKISKDLKQKQWKGQSTADYSHKIRTLFEDILISQSTISSAKELEKIIQIAWQNLQAPKAK
jgi:hypothetical protein